MNFIHKLLLSAAIILGFTVAGFAQNTEVAEYGDYSLWTGGDTGAIYLTSYGSGGIIFGLTKNTGETIKDSKFIIFLEGATGEQTVYLTLDGGVTFVKETISFTGAGFGYATSLVKKTDVKDFLSATTIKFAIQGNIYTVGNQGIKAGITAFDKYGNNPFGGGNENPFAPTGTAETPESWVAKYELEDMNPFNLDNYVNTFLIDAEQHGINVDHVWNGTINIVFNSQDEHILAEPSIIAYTDAMNNDGVVNIIVNPAAWHDASPAKRLAIIYHEMGHDVLNLEHKSDEGPLMSVYARADFSFAELFELRAEMFNDYKYAN